jgi:hypothetical protein
MAVISIARFKAHPARVPEMFENAKKSKEVFLANGAERVDYGSVLAGTGPGEWVMLMQYPSLAAMESAFASAMADPEIAKIFMTPDPPADLTERSIITLVDL